MFSESALAVGFQHSLFADSEIIIPPKPRFVAGFAFSADGGKVALVRKNRPRWQRGRLNAIGGSIEAGESEVQAMRREFREETGVDLPEEAWQPCVVLGNDDFEVTFFRTFQADLGAVWTMTDEEILVVPSLPIDQDALPNLHWLLPMCLDDLDFPVRVPDRNRGSLLWPLLDALRQAPEGNKP